MLTTQSIHDAYSDAISLRRMQLDTQARASRILAHGAQDRAELDELARICDVPRHVLSFDVTGEVAR